MAGRIIALVVIAALGILIWQKNKAVEEFDNEQEQAIRANELGRAEQRPTYFNPDVEGVVPDAPPDFHVEPDLRYEGPRAVMHFTVTESHGWYADNVVVEMWYVHVDDEGNEQQIGNRLQHLCHNYLDFNSTLECQTTLQDHEFDPLFDGSHPDVHGFGTSRNWRARVSSYKNVYAPKP